MECVFYDNHTELVNTMRDTLDKLSSKDLFYYIKSVKDQDILHPINNSFINKCVTLRFDVKGC